MRLHDEIGRHQGCNTRRPVKLLARQMEHHGCGPRTINQLALHALQSQSREVRLGNFVRGARLDEGHTAACWETLLFQCFAHRANGRFSANQARRVSLERDGTVNPAKDLKFARPSKKSARKLGISNRSRHL